MANENGRFTAWVLGIASVLVTTGIFVTGATFWSLKTDIAATATAQAAMNERLVAIEKDVVSRTMDRYTGSDAGKDRAMMMELIQAIMRRNEQQDMKLTELVEFKARIEERMQLGGKP